MTSPAIQVENLGKLYRIGRAQQRHDTLRDWVAATLDDQLKRIRVNGKGRGDIAKDSIWSLRDISFEVQRGEVLGIIGRNGAGKTTLLKILSRITEPTKGRAVINGRVGSLLEVGTGFHPELTGRENVYLNGAILGMRKVEIDRKFDEIVAFAEIQKFLDTPVKRYSSGMYVRLAFAVAAHLEPEILLVDEVLAVGDVIFQKKCLGKMDQIASEGRTVLFVSHNMDAISSLCNRGILLEAGGILKAGDAQSVIDRHLVQTQFRTLISLRGRQDRRGDGRLRITNIFLRDGRGRRANSVRSGEAVEIVAEYESKSEETLPNVNLSFSFADERSRFLFLLDNTVSGYHFEKLPSAGRVVCQIPHLPLSPGAYSFNVFAKVNNSIADWILAAARMDVAGGQFYENGQHPPRSKGGVLVEHSWRLEQSRSKSLDGSTK